LVGCWNHVLGVAQGDDEEMLFAKEVDAGETEW